MTTMKSAMKCTMSMNMRLSDVSSGAFLVLPSRFLSNDYYVITHVSTHPSTASPDISQLGVVALYDETQLEITLPVSVVVENPGYGAYLHNRVVRLLLERYQTYQVMLTSRLH